MKRLGAWYDTKMDIFIISRNPEIYFLFFYTIIGSYLKHALPLILRNIAVHHMCLLFDLRAHCQFIGVALGCAKHHGATVVATVDGEHVAKGGGAVPIGALDGQVLQKAMRKYETMIHSRGEEVEGEGFVCWGEYIAKGGGAVEVGALDGQVLQNKGIVLRWKWYVYNIYVRKGSTFVCGRSVYENWIVKCCGDGGIWFVFIFLFLYVLIETLWKPTKHSVAWLLSVT